MGSVPENALVGIAGTIPPESSASQKCGLSSALFRRVEVPLALK
jgi:hypothetical protein